MWWNLKNVRPEPQPNKNAKVEVNDKSQIEKRLPKLLLIAIKCRSTNVQPPYCQTEC